MQDNFDCCKGDYYMILCNEQFFQIFAILQVFVYLLTDNTDGVCFAI